MTAKFEEMAVAPSQDAPTPAGDTGGSMWVTELSIRRPLLMLMAILSVMIFGLIAYSRLGVDLFPSVEFPVVSVTVPYPGASPEVVESLVTRPVEDAVSGLADLDSVSSTSSEGVAVIIVTFKDKADPKTVAIDVEKRVNAIRGTLPNDILAPTILKFDFTAAPVIAKPQTPRETVQVKALREREQLEVLARRIERDLAAISVSEPNASDTLATGKSLVTQLRSAVATGRLVIRLDDLLAGVKEADITLKDGTGGTSAGLVIDMKGDDGGASTGAIATVFWGCNAPANFYWTGGAFMRQDWFFFLVASLAGSLTASKVSNSTL